MRLSRATVDRVVAMWARWEADPADELVNVLVVVIGDHAFVRAPAYIRSRLTTPPTDLAGLAERLGDDVTEVVGRGRLAYGRTTADQSE